MSSELDNTLNLVMDKSFEACSYCGGIYVESKKESLSSPLEFHFAHGIDRYLCRNCLVKAFDNALDTHGYIPGDAFRNKNE